MKKTEYITFRTSEEVKAAIESIAKNEDRTLRIPGEKPLG